ncbi:MAG: hypothetical protein ACYCOU_03120 [Sulfobacillus sp.]
MLRKLFTPSESSPRREKTLEPLSVIVRLAVYSFLPEKTKISIDSRRINFHRPNSLQGIIRFLNGDSRTDVRFLYLPIETACKRYLVPHRKKLTEVFRTAVEGTKKLHELYRPHNTLVSHCLSWYVQVIEHYLQSDDPLPLATSQQGASRTSVPTATAAGYRELWTSNQVEAIVAILQEMKICKEPKELDALSDSLDKFLQLIENRMENNR